MESLTLIILKCRTSQYSNVLHVHALNCSSDLGRGVPISLLRFYKKYLFVQLDSMGIKTIPGQLDGSLGRYSLTNLKDQVQFSVPHCGSKQLNLTSSPLSINLTHMYPQ